MCVCVCVCVFGRGGGAESLSGGHFSGNAPNAFLHLQGRKVHHVMSGSGGRYLLRSVEESTSRALIHPHHSLTVSILKPVLCDGDFHPAAPNQDSCRGMWIQQLNPGRRRRRHIVSRASLRRALRRVRDLYLPKLQQHHEMTASMGLAQAHARNDGRRGMEAHLQRRP